VTVRGRHAAVVLAPQDYERLLPKPREHVPLARFLKGLELSAIELERERDTVREIEV
jgi:hypothetical protein